MTPAELVLTRPDAVLLPGAVFHGSLTVRNTGSEVRHYALAASGSLAAWTVLESADLRLWPGDQAAVAVRVTVPCEPLPTAGTHTIGVQVANADGTPTSVEQPVEVAPCFRPYLVALHPPALWTAHHALVHVDVGNDGNVHLPVRLMVTQHEGRILWTGRPQGVVLQLSPGQRIRQPVRLTLRRVSLLGKDAPRNYRVVLLSPTTEKSAPVENFEEGVITQMPVVRRWWLAVLAALVVLANTAAPEDPHWHLGDFTVDVGLVVTAVLAVGLAVAALVRYVRVVKASRGG